MAGDLVRRIVPIGFAGVLLLITAAAAASAGAGVSAQTVASACTYSLCPSDNSPFTPFTVGAILGILLLVAIILGVLIFRDRRRGGPRPPAPWSDAAVAGAGPIGGPEAPAGPSSYTETPEDVSVPLPEVPPATTPATGESDIDSLMAELDKISGEILKRGQPAKKEPPAESDESEGSGG